MLMPTFSPTHSGGGGGTLNVEAYPGNLYGFKYGPGSVQTAGAATAMVTNAVGSVTYKWEFVSGTTEVGPVSENAASTRFYSYIDLVPQFNSASWRCKATDSLGNIGYSNPVTITLETLLSGGGGGEVLP